MKMICGLEHLLYEEKLRELGVFIWDKAPNSRETLLQLCNTYRGLTRKMGTICLVGLVMIAQGIMVLN